MNHGSSMIKMIYFLVDLREITFKNEYLNTQVIKMVFESEFKYFEHSLLSSQSSQIFKKLKWEFDSEFKYSEHSLLSSQSSQIF